MAVDSIPAYPGCMQIIPLPNAGQLMLVVTPYVGGETIFDLTARLALAGELEVIDGGNTFNAYRVASALRRIQGGGALRVLEAVRLARAFTCYQLAALLEEVAAPSARTALPLLVLDLLATFGDQSVTVRERRRLLSMCLARLKQIGAIRPVGIWVRTRAVAPEESLEFLARVEQVAGKIWRLDRASTPVIGQGRLF
jgi:hypothetical protein